MGFLYSLLPGFLAATRNSQKYSCISKASDLQQYPSICSKISHVPQVIFSFNISWRSQGPRDRPCSQLGCSQPNPGVDKLFLKLVWMLTNWDFVEQANVWLQHTHKSSGCRSGCFTGRFRDGSWEGITLEERFGWLYPSVTSSDLSCWLQNSHPVDAATEIM